MAAKTERLEIRIRPEHKQLIERAAAASGQLVSQFVVPIVLTGVVGTELYDGSAPVRSPTTILQENPSLFPQPFHRLAPFLRRVELVRKVVRVPGQELWVVEPRKLA